MTTPSSTPDEIGRLRLVRDDERAWDPIRIVVGLPLGSSAGAGRIEVDGDRCRIELPRHLAGTIEVPSWSVRIAAVPERLHTTQRWLAPLLVPSFGTQPTLAILFDDPVRIPALKLRHELDAHLPFTRAESRSDAGVMVDGLLVACDDAPAVLTELGGTDVRVISDVVADVSRHRRAAEYKGHAAHPLPPVSHIAVGLALHVAVLLEVLLFWPLDVAPAGAWAIVAVTVLAALAARPLLARDELARRARHPVTERHGMWS